MLREQLAQLLDTIGREGHGLLVVDVVNPKAAILRFHVGRQVPQELLVLAEDFGGAADGDCVGWRRHGQAARSTAVARHQFQGSNAARSVIL
jgi:hypothetical protein